MRDQYVALIAELDKTLSMVRDMWTESSPDSPEKRKAMLRLDQLLDERMRLMKLRDGLPASPVAAPVPPVKKARKPKAATPQPPVPPAQPPSI